MKIYSTKTGELIQANPSEVPALIQSGEATFKKGEMIPVVDPSGAASTIPAEEFGRALNEGFSLETPELQEQRRIKETYGDSPIQAGLEGAARGLSLGLSDVALRGFGMEAEGLSARKELNAVPALGGEVIGNIAPLVLSGGTSLLGKAASMAPAALAARVGTGVTELVGAGMGSQAAKGLAGKILQSAVPMAAGSAVEGAIYSSGNVLSEKALGNSELNAEKIIAQIGMGAALGGGIGALVGTAAAPFGGIRGKSHMVSELDNEIVGAEQATRAALDAPILNAEQRAGFEAGMAKSSKDAPLIKEAGEAFGVPVFPEQTANSGAVKRASAFLDSSLSPAAIARNNMKDDAINKVSTQVVDMLGGPAAATENQIGNAIKKGLTEEFDRAYEPSKRLYNLVDEHLPYVEITKPATSQIISNIKKADRFNIKGSLENKVGNFIIENLPSMKTAKDIQNLSQSVKDLVDQANPASRRVGTMFAEKLDDLVENATIRAGKKLMAETGDASLGAQVQEVLSAIPSAKKEYAVFREKLDTFAKQLGRKRVSGKAGFEEFLEELAPNKLLDRMFDKKDERFLQFMKVEFPAQFNELISFKKAQLLGQAEKAGSLKKVFDEVGKYSPEVRATIFRPEELKRLQLAEKYLSNITYARHPVFGNAPGTAFMSAAGQAFENPNASLRAWGRDIAIEKFINMAGKSGVDSKLVGTLGAIEKAAQTITSDITNSVKYFLSKSGPAVTYSAVKAFTPEKEEKRKDKQKEFKKQSKEVTDVVANPDLLVEASTKAFADISEHAPGIADAATQKAAQGAMFLYEKMPKNPGGEFNIFANKQWKPSDFEISKWMKYVKTVDDPMSALKDMRKGLLSYEQVDTLKSVYPEIYNETKNAFMEELSGLKEELPYQKKMQIGILFGLPVDYSLNPAFIQQMQLAHTQSMQQEQNNQSGGMTPARADKLNFADKAKSGTQRIMTRA